MVLVNFWRYPDPYQRFLIRIRPNDTDPTGSGSGSETLQESIYNANNPSVDCRNRAPIRSREILKFCARSMRELAVHSWESSRDISRTKKKLKCVRSGYRDLAIG